MTGKATSRGMDDQAFTTGLRNEAEERAKKPLKEILAEKEKRLRDVTALKVPDRVPVVLHGGFHNTYTGLPRAARFYDPIATKHSVLRTVLDFDPDACDAGAEGVSGRAMEVLGDTQFFWPGGPLDPQTGPQFLNKENMREDEYDLLITDPGDFVLRYYMPRRYGRLAALAKLPSLTSLAGTTAVAAEAAGFGDPDVIEALGILAEAGRQAKSFAVWREKEISTTVGVPVFTNPFILNQGPYDLLVSHFRGLHGTTLDMFRRPDEVLKALERLGDWQVTRAKPAAPDEVGKRVWGGGNHMQSEEFMSRKQFEKFPWPSWKRSLTETVNLGYTPRAFMEGKNDDRVECLLELPKGKVIIQFEKIDLPRAKQILGDHLCIAGGIPPSIMWGGSPQQVEDYCRDLIKTCGRGGGFILCCPNLTDAKPANVKAMIDAARKYGTY